MRAVRSGGPPVPADSTSAVKSRRPCDSALRRRSSRHAHNSSAAEGPENRTSRRGTADWPAAAAGAMRARHSADAADFMSLQLDVRRERSAVPTVRLMSPAVCGRSTARRLHPDRRATGRQEQSAKYIGRWNLAPAERRAAPEPDRRWSGAEWNTSRNVIALDRFRAIRRGRQLFQRWSPGRRRHCALLTYRVVGV